MKKITSAQNPIVRHLIRLKEEASYRKESKSLFIEGKKLVLEAQKKGLIKECYLRDDLEANQESATHLTDSLMQKISDLKNSEGYFAEIPYPENQSLVGSQKILVLDRVQNPSNMGALIRSAVAFGFDGLFIVQGSCNPFSPKVIRASMGAVLNIPLFFGTLAELTKLRDQTKSRVYIADAKGRPANETTFQKPFMLVLGNESKGSSLKEDTSCEMISLPIEAVDSLNVAVAGSLLMYVLREAL